MKLPRLKKAAWILLGLVTAPLWCIPFGLACLWWLFLETIWDDRH